MMNSITTLLLALLLVACSTQNVGTQSQPLPGDIPDHLVVCAQCHLVDGEWTTDLAAEMP